MELIISLLIIITGLTAPVILTVLNFAGTFFLDEDEQQQKRQQIRLPCIKTDYNKTSC